MHNPIIYLHSYTIEPRAPHLGGGWRLRCLENGVEVAGGVFPPDPDIEREQALNDAHCEAMNEGESWLADRPTGTLDDVAPPADTRTWIGSGHA